MADLTEAEKFHQELVREYNTYVATVEIDINGARAFNPGHPVPASHVERGVVDASQVAKVGTKAADAAATPAPVLSAPAAPVATA